MLPLLGVLEERAVTEAARICIIALIAAILVVAVDASAVEAAALPTRSVGSVSVEWPSREASRSRMHPSCLLDLSSRAAANYIAAV